uniref:Conserved repeat domain n=3 Tax=Chelativorans TaxID=449972 RepID=Q11MC3_CHESB
MQKPVFHSAVASSFLSRRQNIGGAATRRPGAVRRYPPGLLRSSLTGFLFLAAWVAFGTTEEARAQAGPTVSCTTDGAIFNTAYDSSSGGMLTSGTDANWDVALTTTDITGPPPGGLTYADAVVVDDPPANYTTSPFGNANWISHNSTATQPTPENYDIFYRYEFSLDPSVDPSTLDLQMTFFADNSVYEVWVNGVDQNIQSDYAPEDPYFYSGFQAGNGASGAMNGAWQTGLNTIVVHIKSGPGAQAFMAQIESTSVCQPTLTLRKIVDNSQGGSAGPGDFTLQAEGPTTIQGVMGDPAVTDASVPAGTYALSESYTELGYAASEYSCAIDGGAATDGNSVALENGQSAVCTITNTFSPSFGSCSPSMYLAQNVPTQLFRFETSDNPFDVNPIGPASNNQYNGIAMNPIDNYIYGFEINTTPPRLARVGSDGGVQVLGEIAGFPNATVTGEFSPDGTLYSATAGRLYTVNVTNRTATSVPLTGAATHGPDLAWYNGLLYSVTGTGQLVTIDPATGFVDTVGETGLTQNSFGGMFGASNGIFGSNNVGGFYRFNVETGRGTLISDLQGSGQNDGAKCATTPLTFPADVTIAKDDGSETYTAGGEVVYTIVVSNDGPFGVAGTLVNDPLPDGITDAEWTCGSPTGGGYCSVPSGTGAITDVPVDLPVDGDVGSSVTFTLTMTVPADFEGDLVNTATVTNPSDVPDPDPNDNESTDTNTVPVIRKVKELVGESGELAGVAEPGETLTYEITLTNPYDSARGSYELIDDYDENLTVVDAAGGTDDGDLITWTGLTVPAHDGTNPGQLVLTVQLQVVDPIPESVTRISNIVYEPNEIVDCRVTPTQCYELPASARILRMKQLVAEDGLTEGVAEPGERLTYEITLTNTGGPADDYAIQDLLDENTVFVSADNGGTHSGGNPGGGVVDWTGLSIPEHDGTNPGQLVLTVIATVVDPLPDGAIGISNMIKEPGDPDPVCPSDDCVTVPSQLTGLELVKTGTYEDTDGNGFANVGDTIHYKFTVTNTGNVVLQDVVPEDAGPTFDGQEGGGELSAFDPASATLEPGEETVFEASYVLTQADIDNGAGVEEGVENTATAVGYANGDRVTGTEVNSPGSGTSLDLPAAASNISIAKIANLRAIRRGEQAPFTIRVTNLAGSRVDGLTVVDRIPPGFRYVEGSATVGDVAVEPVEAGREIRFENLSLEGNQEIEIRLRMLALSSAGPGEHVNRARAEDASGRQLAPEAQAVVEILAEPVFDCGDVIGKVFDDVNRNGYQDQGEPGLPGVRVATVKGWLITTDEYGRFHVACADLPEARIGSNFIMKLDTRTLPTGYRLTTENPRVVRLTAGKTTKLNFGAAVGRVVRLELTDAAFAPDAAQLKPEWAESVDRLIGVLAEEQSVLRLTYFYGGVDRALAGARIMQARELIAERWRRRGGAYRLEIEMRVEAVQ